MKGLPDVPSGFMARAAALVRDAGGVVIFDEVQAGFGRTGRWWGYEVMDCVPDIVAMGKPMGAGLPLSGVGARADIAKTFHEKGFYFNTTAATPLQAAVGGAVLDVIEEQQLLANVAAVGGYLKNRLTGLADRFEGVGDVRGHGLFLGIDWVQDRDTRKPDRERCGGHRRAHEGKGLPHLERGAVPQRAEDPAAACLRAGACGRTVRRPDGDTGGSVGWIRPLGRQGRKRSRGSRGVRCGTGGWKARLIVLHSQSENTVFRVEGADGAAYALRVHRPGYHDLGELESEHVWTSDLAAAGISVPKTVETLDGSAYATVAFPESGETRHVGLVEWIDGTPLHQLLQDRDDDAELADVSRRTRRHHRGLPRRHRAVVASARFPAPCLGRSRDSSENDPSGAVSGRSPTFPDADRARLLAIRNAMLASLSEFRRGPERYGMIHADLNLGNVLRAADRLVVIDFDDAGFGWFGFDLAVALWQQLDVLHQRPRFAMARDALFAAYARRRPDGEASLATVPLFLLMRTLMLLKWIEDRPEVGRAKAIPGFVKIAFAQADELGI